MRFAELSDLPLVQLCSKSSTYDFDHISTYAHGVGPDSWYVMFWKADGIVIRKHVDPSTPSEFVTKMHELDLQVHPYTLKIDSLKYESTPSDEINLYFNKGVDGVFTEFVSTVLTVFE